MTAVAIVDYGTGNLRSAAKAFERMADAVGLGAGAVTVTADPEVVARADRVVLPGDGAFAACRRGILDIPGLIEAIDEAVVGRGQPFFGICIGMQLMATVGHEHGTHPGFGWIPGTVERLAPSDTRLKIPHMGWNDLRFHRSHPVLAGVRDGDHAYFVHSYALQPAHADHLLASADYGGPVTAIVGRDNCIGSQFHPEKSQAFGLALIAGFLKWQP